MSLKPQQSNFQGKAYEPTPAGNHVARVYRVLHLGTIKETYLGEEKMVDKVLIGFELLNEKRVFKTEKGEEPFVISKEFTLSMGEKANLRKLIEGMFGVALQDTEARGFDVFSIIGEPCLVNVVHKVSGAGKTYADVKGASPIPKGMPVPPAYNPVQKLSFGDDWNEQLFQSLPSFIKDKITSSKEYKTMRGTTAEEFPLDIPF